MRSLKIILLLLICSGAMASERQFVVPFNGSPEISVLIMDTQVEDFEITRAGLVTWNVWENQKPSENPPQYQYDKPEYEQTLARVLKVFERNYKPASDADPNEASVTYVIRVGEYWSSLVLNLSYGKTQPIPTELDEFMSYIRGLQQSDKLLPPTQ